MAQKSLSCLLIIGRNPEFLQMSQNLFQNLTVLLHTKPAFRTGNDVMGAGCIESGHYISFFVSTKWELCLIPVSPRIFHAYDLRHCKVRKTANTGQMIPDFFRFEIKLCLIGHCLQLTAAALAGKFTSGRAPYR